MYNVAIATGIISLALGVRFPPTTAIIGGFTADGVLVADPYWEVSDLVALHKEGVSKIVFPSSALASLQAMVDNSREGVTMELVPVETMQDLVVKVLKGLVPAAAQQPGAIAQDNSAGSNAGGGGGNADEEDDDSILDLNWLPEDSNDGDNDMEEEVDSVDDK